MTKTETSSRPTHRVYAVKKIGDDKSHGARPSVEIVKSRLVHLVQRLAVASDDERHQLIIGQFGDAAEAIGIAGHKSWRLAKTAIKDRNGR